MKFSFVNFKSIINILFISLSTCIFSCQDDVKKNRHTSNIVFPDSNISFSQYVNPLFRQTCVDAGCHGSYQPAGELNLEDDPWNALSTPPPTQTALIFAGNGYESRLVMYLDGRLAPRMPLLDSLTQNQINGVKKWIDEGAQPN